MRTIGWMAVAVLTSGVANAQEPPAADPLQPTQPPAGAGPDAQVPPADVQPPDVQTPDVQPPDVQPPDVQPPDVQPPDVQPPVPAPAPAVDAETQSRLRALERQVDLALGGRPGDRGPQDLPDHVHSDVHGFASAGVSASSKGPPVTADLGDVVVGYDGHFGHGAAAHVDLALPSNLGGALDLIDRAELSVGVTEHMTLRVGQLYTPYGYWNSHTPIETFAVVTRDRPAVLADSAEGAFFATRQAGVDLAGRYLLGSSQVGWRVGLGNGRSPHLDQSASFTSNDRGAAAWAALWVQAPNGFQLGASGGYDQIRPITSEQPARNVVVTDLDEIVLNAHIALLRPRTEVLGEVFYVLHNVPGEERTFNRNGYLQVSHRGRTITPYVRLEYTEKWALDPLYILQGDTRSAMQELVGVRRDLRPNVAVKVEGFAEQAAEYGLESTEYPSRFGGGFQLAAAF